MFRFCPPMPSKYTTDRPTGIGGTCPSPIHRLRRAGLSSALVLFPIPIPSGCPSACNHGTVHVSAAGRRTPSGCTISPGRAFRNATHRRAFDQDMSVGIFPCRRAEESDQRVPCGRSVRGRTRVAGAAGAVPFPRRYPGKPDPGTLLAPNRPITVPHGDWRTRKGLSARDDNRGE